MLTDLETWLHDEADMKLFDVYVPKKIFTPLEIEKKYTDESREEQVLACVLLVEAVELPNKDVLLGFRLSGEYYETSPIFYYKLSEIRIEDVKDTRRAKDLTYDE